MNRLNKKRLKVIQGHYLRVVSSREYKANLEWFSLSIGILMLVLGQMPSIQTKNNLWSLVQKWKAPTTDPQQVRKHFGIPIGYITSTSKE